MSFDLGVWYSDVPLTREEAGEFYQHLNRNRIFVRRHPQFDAFWKELMARFPDSTAPEEPQIGLDERDSDMLQTPAEREAADAAFAANPPPLPDNFDPSTFPVDDDSEPWAATLAPNGFAVAMPIRFSRVDELAVEIFTLVRRHGLVIYNPQEHWVWYPPKLDRRKPRPVPPVLRLQIAGKIPALSVTLSLGNDPVLQATLPTRLEAHATACASAIEKGLDFYEVDDPASVAQSLYWEPLEPDDPGYPCVTLPPGTEVSRLRIKDED
jgi:hypothetical protein